MGNTLTETGPVARVNVAEIVNHGEKLILPEHMGIGDAIELLERRLKYMEENVALSEVFDVFPWDGAHALMQVLTKRYGWAASEPTPGFFGSKPPQMLTIETGFGQVIRIPWGLFSLPGIEGHIETGATKKDGRVVFAISGATKRKNEAAIGALFDDMREYLKTGSIYRGKAIKLRFRDDDGGELEMPEPKFLDTSWIDRNCLIYSDDVQASIETNLFTPIGRCADLIANGIPIKRGVLLGGMYGTGKTLAAHVASKLAVDNNITYLYVPRADELADAIKFAKQYQSPACVIFCEDIDRAVSGERTVEMDDILNIIDGIDTKNANIIVVMTTNALDAINPAMLRPGRLDAVIEVSPPDSNAVEKLLRLYGGDTIGADVDLSEVAHLLAGNIPAVIAEVVKRARLSQLRLQPAGHIVNQVGASALIEAAATMKRQLAILHAASQPKEAQVTLDTVMQDTLNKALNGTKEKVGEIHRHVYANL